MDSFGVNVLLMCFDKILFIEGFFNLFVSICCYFGFETVTVFFFLSFSCPYLLLCLVTYCFSSISEADMKWI